VIFVNSTGKILDVCAAISIGETKNAASTNMMCHSILLIWSCMMRNLRAWSHWPVWHLFCRYVIMQQVLSELTRATVLAYVVFSNYRAPYVTREIIVFSGTIKGFHPKYRERVPKEVSKSDHSYKASRCKTGARQCLQSNNRIGYSSFQALQLSFFRYGSCKDCAISVTTMMVCFCR